jgi:hypothetical protein
MAIAEHRGQPFAFDPLREQEGRERLRVGEGAAFEAHRLEGWLHLILQVACQHSRAFGVLAFGGDGDTPRERLPELAGVELPLGEREGLGA